MPSASSHGAAATASNDASTRSLLACTSVVELRAARRCAGPPTPGRGTRHRPGSPAGCWRGPARPARCRWSGPAVAWPSSSASAALDPASRASPFAADATPRRTARAARAAPDRRRGTRWSPSRPRPRGRCGRPGCRPAAWCRRRRRTAPATAPGRLAGRARRPRAAASDGDDARDAHASRGAAQRAARLAAVHGERRRRSARRGRWCRVRGDGLRHAGSSMCVWRRLARLLRRARVGSPPPGSDRRRRRRDQVLREEQPQLVHRRLLNVPQPPGVPGDRLVQHVAGVAAVAEALVADLQRRELLEPRRGTRASARSRPWRAARAKISRSSASV